MLHKTLEKTKGQSQMEKQRNWQHCVHKTQAEDKQNKTLNTICIGHHYA